MVCIVRGEIYSGYNGEFIIGFNTIVIGETKEGFTIPLDIINIVGMAVSTELNFTINNETFYLLSTVKNEKDSHITKIELEKTITLYLDQHNNSIKFKNHVFNNLTSQLKVFPFFLEFVKGGDFYINDEFLGTINTNKKAEEKVQHRIKRFETLKKGFDKAGIDNSIEIGETDNIENEINIFIDIVLNEKYDLLSLPENMGENGFIIAPYKLGNVHFLMCYVTDSLHDVSENLPRFFSIYSSPMDRFQALVSTSEKERTFDISVYVPITLYNLLCSDDIDSTIVINALDRSEVFTASELKPDVNEFGLNCLRVYDKKKNQEWLHIAQHIFSKLTDDISKINYAQTTKRLEGNLNEKQKNYLFDMKINLISDNTLEQLLKKQMLFCIAVLLEQLEEASKLLNSFSNEEKKAIKDWPIYPLHSKL